MDDMIEWKFMIEMDDWNGMNGIECMSIVWNTHTTHIYRSFGLFCFAFYAVVFCCVDKLCCCVLFCLVLCLFRLHVFECVDLHVWLAKSDWLSW